MQIIHVGQNEANQRLDKLLTKYMNKAPKSFIYKMLRKKNITLNGKKATGNELLNMEDEIKLFLSDETIEKFSGLGVLDTPINKPDLSIIYEDSHIMIINKPSGMLSQKARIEDISLVDHITSYLLLNGEITKEELKSFRPSICNRLDRNTSGIIVAGKSLMGLQVMSKILKDRSIHKYYRCIVSGKILKGQKIDGYLTKNAETNKVSLSTSELANSSYIQTEYRPIAIEDGITLLEVALITGRSHQIRAHLASIGHPIIGDYKYGNKKTNDGYKKKYGITSQLLHSYRLELPEIDGELSYLSGKTFIAEVPLPFGQVLNAIRN